MSATSSGRSPGVHRHMAVVYHTIPVHRHTYTAGCGGADRILHWQLCT